MRMKAAPVMSAINVIPMADIMLVLLIIFMVITPLLTPTVPVDKAEVPNPREMDEASKDDALNVAVTRNGTVYLGHEQMGPGHLHARLAELVAQQASRTVYVHSDARAKYGAVVAAVDEVRAAGIERIALLTEKAIAGRQTWE